MEDEKLRGRVVGQPFIWWPQSLTVQMASKSNRLSDTHNYAALDSLPVNPILHKPIQL